MGQCNRNKIGASAGQLCWLCANINKEKNMVKIAEEDILGARASNAGDRFHELWALRKALALLEPDSPYKAISVEGVPLANSSPSDGTWSAVDVCLMSGGKSLGKATSAEFAQLKYSTASPGTAWTVARLVSNSAKRGNNSVLRKLAETYEAAESIRASENAGLAYCIKLVSNQPVSADVLRALGKHENAGAIASSTIEADKEKLRVASRLTKAKFADFASKLDFSECGEDSLFEQEEKAIRALDRLIEGDTRPWRLELLRFISDAMLPTGSREPITEETLLSRLEIGTEYALYPCPNQVAPVSSLIEREGTRRILAALLDGTQRVGIHGGAGCGKTTTISQLATMLPEGSVCIQYDCYGGGSYLDDSAPRHRPTEAFTQLSNEIASRLRVPRLLRTSERGNPVRAFKERLMLGAAMLRESAPEALLVVAVDAADNAVAAAARRDEQCFVAELASIAELPANVRVVISARTARIEQLGLPPSFVYQLIEPFNSDETMAYVRSHIASPDGHWVTEFHTLTRGIPRVQAYAFKLSANPEDAIQYLLPNGKELNQIFEQAVVMAWQKGGEPSSIGRLCAALISLPRPVPLAALADAISSDTARTTDLCQDLYPTLVIKGARVSFSDEDFEDFVADRGKAELDQVRARIAEYLLGNANRDAYAARHAVQALIAAKREQDALRLAVEEPLESLFSDPVERRVCQLERMRSALRVCSQTGNAVESLTILLVGAEALRTSDAIARELALNPDLSARHARESLDRLVLADDKYVEANGPILCHYMAEDAMTRSFSQVERSRRLFFAWQSARATRRVYRQHSQHLTAEDIAAFCSAEAATDGVGAVLPIFRRLRHDRYAVFSAFVARSLARDDVETLQRLLAESRLPTAARVQLNATLAKAGCQIDLDETAALLTRLLVRRAVLTAGGEGRERTPNLREYVLDLCELAVNSSANIDLVRRVLADITQSKRPRWQYIQLANQAQIDVLLRAECLLAELDGRSLDARGILDIEGSSTGGWRSDSGVTYEVHQKQSELIEFFSAYLPFYQARARYVTTHRHDEFIGSERARWMDRLRYMAYSASRSGVGGMHYRLAESVSSLVALGDGHARELFEVVTELLATSPVTFGSREAGIFRPFSWRPESYGWLTEFAEARQATVSDLKTTSSEKASSLLELARLLLDCSPSTSASLFKAAVLVLGDIDVNEMLLLGTFDKLSRVAAGTLDSATLRSAAIGLASFGTAVAFRLRDYDHFPWNKLSRGITRLDASVALAAAARWDDEGLAGVSEVLRPILETGVNAGSISPQNAVACRYLLGRFSETLISEILRTAESLDEDTRLTIREVLAECEALARSPNPRLKVDAEIVKDVPAAKRRRWGRYLAERCKFFDAQAMRSNLHAGDSDQDGAERSEKVRNFLDGLDWGERQFDSASRIAQFAKRAYERTRDDGSFLSIGRELYRRIRATVPAHRRSEHLTHLAELISADDASYDVIEAIVDAIVDWSAASITVRDWSTANLPRLIAARLMSFMLLMREKSPLSRLMEQRCIAAANLYEALLAGLAKNIEEFDATSIYALVEILAEVVEADEVGCAIAGYIDRLAARLRVEDQMDSLDIPTSSDEAFARLLYAYLSDIDLAVRWRVTHAVRSLFWLEASSVIDKLVSSYSVVSEKSFRAPGSPFYWLAARLWLTISVSRACQDRPTYAVRYAGYLFAILNDNDFPHVVVRAFAKQGVMALVDAGILSLTPQQRKLVASVDSSQMRRKKRPRELDYEEDRGTRKGRERRFHFDALDTLRYWYPGMARIFSSVPFTQFVDEAERWIVDRWGVTSNPTRWDEETRRDKFKHNPLAMSHSHGGLPSVERFHTHLEWHAMWCATGELLKSQAVAKSEYGNDQLREELNSATTVSPALWLSDLRSPKPLEELLWALPNTGVKWVSEPSVNDVVELLGLRNAGGWCVVQGDYDRYWCGLHESVHVTSCLVSPGTAPALLRALQSTTNVHAHYLPLAQGDGDGIDIAGFELKGWLSQSEEHSGLDSKDDYAEGISPRLMQPSDAVRRLLNLVPSNDFLFGWERQPNSDLVFYSEQWADNIPDRRFREETDCMRSKGERLHCRLGEIAQVLRREKCSLLIKVQTHRKEYEEGRYSESDKGESAYFNRYILLTSQGCIADATGHIGTWKIAG